MKKFSTIIASLLLATALLVGCGGKAGSNGKQSSGGPVAISVQPQNGGPGALINITGSNFPAETKVGVFIGSAFAGFTGQPFGDGQSDKDGKLSIAFPMPGLWPDGTPITEKDLLVVVGNEDGTLQAAAPFTYAPQPASSGLPVLLLNPISSIPGGVIDVQGEGFAAGSQVALRLGSPTAGIGMENLMTANADAAGSFKVTLTIPAVWPSGGEILDEGAILAAADLSQPDVLATAAFLNLKQSSPGPTEPNAQTNWLACGEAVMASPEPAGFVTARVSIVRGMPELDSSLLATIQQCQELQLTGRTADNQWLEVQLPGGASGWVYADYVQPNLAIDALPVTVSSEPATPVAKEAIDGSANAGVVIKQSGGKVTVTVKGLGINKDLAATLSAPGVNAVQVVAKGKTDAAGAANFSFDLPKTWANSEPITQDNLTLIIATIDGASKSAPLPNLQ